MSAIKRVDCILQNMCYYFVFFFFWLTKHQTGMEHEMCDGGRHRKLYYSVSPPLCKFHTPQLLCACYQLPKKCENIMPVLQASIANKAGA